MVYWHRDIGGEHAGDVQFFRLPLRLRVFAVVEVRLLPDRAAQTHERFKRAVPMQGNGTNLSDQERPFSR